MLFVLRLATYHRQFSPVFPRFGLGRISNEGKQRCYFPVTGIEDAQLSREVDGEMTDLCAESIFSPGEISFEDDFVAIADDIVGAEEQRAFFLRFWVEFLI